MKRIILLFSLLLSAFSVVAAQQPLKPEDAFKLRAYAKDAHTITAEWTIAEGYYLYKEKFKFSTQTPGYELDVAAAVFPKGKIKQDEYFGQVESFRNKISIDIPLSRAVDAPEELVLDTVSQGCADLGLCYPPQKVSVSLFMPPLEDGSFSASPAQSGAAGNSLLGKLGQSLGLGKAAGGNGSFLEPAQAFALSTEVTNGNVITVSWDIADGYYLYKDRMAFSLMSADGVSLAAPVFSSGAKLKHDEYFGEMSVYYHQAVVTLPLERSNFDPTDVQLKVSYQGCAEAGFCYPPQTDTLGLSLPKGSASASGIAAGAVSESDSIAASLAGDSLGWIILSFFGFGLLLAFTPCVFPMVPILSSIIVGQGESLTTRKAFTMSLVYVLAMAATYTVAGVFAGMVGENLQAAFQNPWVLSVFALIFVALSLSMFGFYELQLPTSWQTKLTSMSNSQKGGTLIGVGIMGFLSALIVGPCVAAPLAGALIYIGQTGDAVLGGTALFAMSLGMGAPLLVIGTSAGKLLPRAGVWMEKVKAVFGLILIGVAIWMLERILSVQISMLLWAALAIGSGIYFGAIRRAAVGKISKTIGWLLLVYGVALAGAAVKGGNNVLNPLEPFLSASDDRPLVFKRIKSLQDLRDEITQANRDGRPVMLDFYADWCVSCIEMEHKTFAKAPVQAALQPGVMLQADVTANDDIDKELMKEFGIIGPPAILFFDRQGNELRELRVVGFKQPDEFQAIVNQAFAP
ncbi:MAG: protein-disulfide reductase DsbD [Gammaproteobacteria bacterium]|nr:protein-disulfide reductase DsbD [Gammaproteobacteria bacterium]